ncbi:hypothetical protein TNCV_803631 [Trichonephila clavipes]|nr:hypothetical protein TNCV_803631 [Trichonephila clavipes]
MDGDCKAKLADGTVVEIEAGASLFTDPISDRETAFSIIDRGGKITRAGTAVAQRYQANGLRCEAMAVLTCPKPIPLGELVIDSGPEAKDTVRLKPLKSVYKRLAQPKRYFPWTQIYVFPKESFHYPPLMDPPCPGLAAIRKR